MVLKAASFLLLNFVLSFLSYFVPKNKKQILLGSSTGNRIFGSPKYFLLYLSKIEYHHRFFWITANKKIFSELKNHNLPVLYLYSLTGFKAILRSEFLVFTHTVLDVSYSFLLPGRFNKIETWHGTSLKKIGKSDLKQVNKIRNCFQILVKSIERKSYRLILSASDDITESLYEAFENSNIKVLGHPCNDVFFHNNLIFIDYKQALNLKSYRKVILFCPTFRDEKNPRQPFSAQFLNQFNNYLKDENSILLVKRHFADQNKLSIKDYSNIKDVTDVIADLHDLLVCTDILITDYSGVCFDFVLLNKPIVFYPYDYNEYIQNRGHNYDYYLSFFDFSMVFFSNN